MALNTTTSSNLLKAERLIRNNLDRESADMFRSFVEGEIGQCSVNTVMSIATITERHAADIRDQGSPMVAQELEELVTSAVESQCKCSKRSTRRRS